MLEFMPSSKHAFVGSIYFVFEGMTSLIGVIYFTWISKHWIWFALVGFVFQCLAVLCSFVVPESPKWLFKKQQYARTALVFQKIARYNGMQESLDALNAEIIEQECDENSTKRNNSDDSLTMTVLLNNTDNGDSNSFVDEQLFVKAGLESSDLQAVQVVREGEKHPDESATTVQITFRNR